MFYGLTNSPMVLSNPYFRRDVTFIFGQLLPKKGRRYKILTLLAECFVFRTKNNVYLAYTFRDLTWDRQTDAATDLEVSQTKCPSLIDPNSNSQSLFITMRCARNLCTRFRGNIHMVTVLFSIVTPHKMLWSRHIY